MPPDMQETPFVKQLAANGVFHTDRPVPQQRLSRSLAALLLPLPLTLFFPFLQAFWTTILQYWSSIPSLRLDKYLFLIRQYVSHSFTYLQQHNWDEGTVVRYLDLVEGKSGPGPLSAGDGKVPDGVRYHVLDVWVDGLVECEGWDETVVMRPVERLWRQGRTKIVRGRARDVLDDERLKAEGNGAVENEERNDYDVGEDGDWEGFAD